jgi:hypothetical protein
MFNTQMNFRRTIQGGSSSLENKGGNNSKFLSAFGKTGGFGPISPQNEEDESFGV